ncbi:hypothetical protein [uncultured Gammaproteobacteria bacterium]|jgi:hypothetical protein|nr:hypothetical protein [uncultured Gammaproteobacteria bacterium]CAC9988857.1 hypothetical protein [uncultured Gammaproteobacteria bacterium]CAC9991643.1 hypothetical protein [uncultured Gammaproteobacteria bacterium]CAC9998776.1 hypothetical protein [uncultured Gammaproteobacteria bacterium]
MTKITENTIENFCIKLLKSKVTNTFTPQTLPRKGVHVEFTVPKNNR